VDAVTSGAADRTSGVWFRCTIRVNSSAVLASSTSGKRCTTLELIDGSAALNENITASQKPTRMSVLR